MAETPTPPPAQDAKPQFPNPENPNSRPPNAESQSDSALPSLTPPPPPTPFAANPNPASALVSPAFPPSQPVLMNPYAQPPSYPSFRPAGAPPTQFTPVSTNPNFPSYQPHGVPPPGVSSAPGMVAPSQMVPGGMYQVPPPGQPPNPLARPPYVTMPNGFMPPGVHPGTIPPPGVPHYPYQSIVRPAFPLRPPGTVGVIPQISRPPMLGIRPPVMTGLVRPPVVPMVTLVEKPQTTVYVGKIATTVENDFMLSLLQFCGAVKSWKRPQDPSNGTPKAFGFCEFESAEGALRAVRLLSKVNIDGQELVLKNESGSKDDDTGGLLSDEDREADREATEKIANTIEERLRNRPPPLPLKLDVTATPNSEGPARSAEKDSDIDVKKDPSELQDTEVLREVSVVEESEDPCSIFLLLPEDYEIEKDKLIQLWMAGKWINDEQHGDKLFSSFFQNGYLSHCSSNLETGKARYKIVAQKIKALRDSQTCNASYFLQWNKYFLNHSMPAESAESIRHLSLGCNAEIDAKTFKAIEMFTQLRTLLFLGNRDHGAIQIPRHLFSVFNHLATLDLSGTHMKELPSSIEHIRGLRYLDLSWTLIEWLPNILCTLVQLQTLKLRGCYNLTVLPENLHQLTKLRHLDFDVLGQLEIMPPKMGKLVDLRTLPAFLVGTGDGRKILELNKVNSLSGELCIANLENVENGDEAKAAALTYKEHLKTLELRWTSSEICGTHDNSEVILDKLEPSKKLEELKITCYEGESFPCWIGDSDFGNLTSIVLYRCENLLYVPAVEQLPNLKHLRLVRMDSVKEIVNEQGQQIYAAFPNLEKLEINEMQSLENWDWKNSNEGDFSSLSHLIIEDCPKLARFDVVSHLPSIRHFEIRNCPKLETLSDRKLSDSLEELIVDDCPPLQQRFIEGGDDWHKIEHVLNKSISGVDEDEWITGTKG